MEYIKDGLKHLQLKFYIEGSEPGLKGIVHSESKEVCVDMTYESRFIHVSFQKCIQIPKSLSTFKRLKSICHEQSLKTYFSCSLQNPETGRYEFRYIFVEVDTYPRRTIIIEDNR